MGQRQAAAACLEALDGAFFRALAEPARVAILRTLITEGRSDVGTIASRAPHDRSVTTRHLRVLEAARLVRSTRQGRHTYYELDGAGTLAHLEGLVALFTSIAPVCCKPSGSSGDLVEPDRGPAPETRRRRGRGHAVR